MWIYQRVVIDFNQRVTIIHPSLIPSHHMSIEVLDGFWHLLVSISTSICWYTIIPLYAQRSKPLLVDDDGEWYYRPYISGMFQIFQHNGMIDWFCTLLILYIYIYIYIYICIHLHLDMLHSCIIVLSLYVPFGNLTWMLKITIIFGKNHYKWSCSIAM